jgi:hypothetical protein
VLRIAPVVLVLCALGAQSYDRHGLAFALLVAGVPAAALSALVVFGRLVELSGGVPGERRARVETSLAALGLVLVLVAAAAGGQAPQASALPPLTTAAIAAALAVYVLQAVTALVSPRHAPAPAPPPRAAPAADAPA